MQAGRLPGTPIPMHAWTGYGEVKIAGDSWGDPTGPLVLLLHGGGQTRHAWKTTGEVLGSAGYHAVAFDARGHGDSGWAQAGEYDDDFMVKDLLCVLRALGGGVPVLVGASMGGGTSLIAVGEAHLRAAGLVLVDMAPRIELEGAQEILEFMGESPEGFGSLEEAADAISTFQPHRPRPHSLHGLAKNLRLTAEGRYRWHWDPAWHRGRRAITEYRDRLHACADRLSVPTLLVRGALSNVLSDASVRSFLDQCPHAEYVRVENAAHMVAGDKNDVFASAVIGFLERIVPAKPHASAS